MEVFPRKYWITVREKSHPTKKDVNFFSKEVVRLTLERDIISRWCCEKTKVKKNKITINEVKVD